MTLTLMYNSNTVDNDYENSNNVVLTYVVLIYVIPTVR